MRFFFQFQESWGDEGGLEVCVFVNYFLEEFNFCKLLSVWNFVFFLFYSFIWLQERIGEGVSYGYFFEFLVGSRDRKGFVWNSFYDLRLVGINYES